MFLPSILSQNVLHSFGVNYNLAFSNGTPAEGSAVCPAYSIIIQSFLGWSSRSDQIWNWLNRSLLLVASFWLDEEQNRESSRYSRSRGSGFFFGDNKQEIQGIPTSFSISSPNTLTVFQLQLF